MRWGPRTLDVDVLWVDGRDRRRARPPGAAPPDVGAALRAGPAGRPRPGPRARRPVCEASAGEVPSRRRRPPGRASADDVTRSASSARVGPAGPCTTALGRARWPVEPLLGRGDGLAAAADGVDLVVIATPDARRRRGGGGHRAPPVGRRGPPLRLARPARRWLATRAGRCCTRSWPCPTRSGALSASSARGSGWPTRATRWWRRSWRSLHGRTVRGRGARLAPVPRGGRHRRRTTSSPSWARSSGWRRAIGAPLDAFLDLARGSARRRRRARAARLPSPGRCAAATRPPSRATSTPCPRPSGPPTRPSPRRQPACARDRGDHRRSCGRVLDAHRASGRTRRVRAHHGLPARGPRVAHGCRPRRDATSWWRRSS